jgi:hypothetical protein
MMLPTVWLAANLLFQGLDQRGTQHTAPLSQYVKLSLATDRDAYYRGELLRLTITAENVSQIPVTAYLTLDPRFGKAKVFYRRVGAQFVELKSLRQGGLRYAEPRCTLGPSERRSIETDVSVTSLPPEGRQLVLDSVGRYEFKVVYLDTPDDPANGALESPIIPVNVVDAPANERAAQAAYTPALAYAAQFKAHWSFLTPAETQAAADFIQRFSQSRYAPPVKQGLRLSLDYRQRIGRATVEEAALWELLFAHLDNTPPFLDVFARPSRLWPADHQLVPITVAVHARDNEDPHPTIKLVSITCNDRCNPATDIVDAVFDADVRQFQLRAETRTDAHHEGEHDQGDANNKDARVYTITYSAEDASGNKRISTTSVCVAPGNPNQHCGRDDDRDRDKKRDSDPDDHSDRDHDRH